MSKVTEIKLNITEQQYERLAALCPKNTAARLRTDYYFDCEWTLAKTGNAELRICEDGGTFFIVADLPAEFDCDKLNKEISPADAVYSVTREYIKSSLLPEDAIDDFSYVGYVDTEYMRLEIAPDIFAELQNTAYIWKSVHYICFRPDNTEQKERFEQFLQAQAIKGVPLSKTNYACFYEVIKEREKKKAAKANALTVVGSGRYYSKARYDVQNCKRLIAELAAFDEYYSENPTKDRRKLSFGISGAEYDDVKKTCDNLSELFSTSLCEYHPLFRDMFLAGLSLQEYAEKYLPDRKKKTAENMANRLYKAVAAEYERADRAMVKSYPKYGDMSPLHRKAIDDFMNVRIGVSKSQFEQLVEKGMRRQSELAEKNDTEHLDSINKFKKQYTE